MSQEQQPEIHQTLFIVDKNRRYVFDVNQNIRIKKLKQMIIAAADLNKTGLRIFHEGKEYTDYDESALDELFPDLKYVEFYIQYTYDQIEDLEEIIDLKLQQHCLEHEDKYPYFYCFTCGKSICNKCILSGKHNGHETKEKYDYLLASKNLVEVLFKDLKDLLKNTKEGSNDTIDGLKAKVRIQFFPKLVELVKKIENNMMNLILFYLEKEKGNYNTIENNVKLLKSHCEEGLDKLKEEIVIEDIMLDENVFLTFDSKFKEIGKEKEKFQEDIDKYKQFSNNINLIEGVIEKTYKEIYDFLIKYLTVTEFENIKEKINSQNIDVIDKKRILNTLLSDVKKRPNSEKKNLRMSQKSINQNNPNTGYYLRNRNINNINNINNTTNDNNLNVNLFPKVNKQKEEMEIENDNNNNINNYNNLRNANKRYNLRSIRPREAENYIQIEDDNDNNIDITNEPKEKNKNKEENNTNMIETGYTFDNMGPLAFKDKNTNINNSTNVTDNFYNSGKKIKNEEYNDNINNNINVAQKELEESEEELSNSPIYNIICNIVPSKNQIVLYNVDKDSITRKTMSFNTLGFALKAS